MLREWGSSGLAPDSELLVSELVTNAVQTTAGRYQAAVPALRPRERALGLIPAEPAGICASLGKITLN